MGLRARRNTTDEGEQDIEECIQTPTDYPDTPLTQLGTRSFPAYLSMGKAGMVIEGGTGPTTDIIVDQLEH